MPQQQIYGGSMVRRLLPTVALAVLLLSGCTAPSDPTPTPTPSADAPLFASEEEAVEAAEAALKEYFAVSNAINQDGGKGGERLAPVSTDDWYSQAGESFAELIGLGWHQVGDISFEDTTLQQTFSRDEKTNVVVLTCMDYSDRTMIDKDGVQIDMSEIPERRRFEISLQTSDDGNSLVVHNAEPWSPDEC